MFKSADSAKSFEPWDQVQKAAAKNDPSVPESELSEMTYRMAWELLARLRMGLRVTQEEGGK